MKARKFKLPAMLMVCTLVLALGTGCGGKRVGSLVDPADPANKPKETPAPATPTPTPAPTTPPTVLPGQPGNPGNPALPGTPGYTGAQLQAKGEVLKNGSFLGMGEIIIEVKVTNPSTSTLTGEVTVVFTNGGKTTTEMESMRVVVLPGETVTRHAERRGIKYWGLDSAQVTVKTDAPAAATNTYGYGY